MSLPSGEALAVLTDATLSLTSGISVAIEGRSGSGKSTLLNIIGLLDAYDAGSYTIDGVEARDLSDADASHLRGATFGFVFQQFHLLERRSALANVCAPLAHGPAREFHRRKTLAAELLDRVGLSDRMSSMPSQLSGGEQQRVAIARSLIRRPRILLADEPTGSLDAETGDVVLKILLGLAREAGCAIVLVTHDDGVARMTDRRAELRQGALSWAA